MISFIVTIATTILLIPVLFFCLEVFGSVLGQQKYGASPNTSTKITSVIIVPAHNEGRNIVSTLKTLLQTRTRHQSILLVADNCSDDTAQIARSVFKDHKECHVAERTDPDLRGKGYALAFGLEQIASSPPDVVVIFDADCQLEEGALERLTQSAADTGRPVQAMYLMNVPQNAPAEQIPKLRVSAFAWMIMNKVRMSGLYALFDVTRLTGSGMAFPYAVLRDHFQGTGNIVEDLALTVTLTKQGFAPILLSDANVYSDLAARSQASTTQRARWEQGSLNVARQEAFALFAHGIRKADLRAMVLAIDIAIPPLVITMASLCLIFLGLAVIALAGIIVPFYTALAVSILFGTSLILAWFIHGREILPLSAFSGLAAFIAQKLKIYGKEGRRSTKEWTRTDRD